MGLFCCILFGIIGSWIAIALNPRLKPVKGSFVLFTGAIGGAIGALAGMYFNFADIDKFNMYSIGMGVVASLILTSLVALVNRTAANGEPEVELLYDDENY